MIRIAWRPLAPCPRSNANCAPSCASAAALGRNCRPDSARPKAFTPGASRAAIRPGPRSSALISWRSPAHQLSDQWVTARRGPAGAEGDVLGGRPLDVRHAPPVAGDRDARARTLDLRRRFPRREPERLSLEEPAQIGVLHVVAQARETLVERDLVGRVLREDDAARLARREDVPCLRRVVGGGLRPDGPGPPC